MQNAIQNNFTSNYSENESTLNLSEIFKTIIRKKRFVGGVTAFTLLASTSLAFLVKPIWEGSFQIVLRDRTSESASSMGAAIINSQPGLRRLLGTQGENQLDTEVKILESTSILKPIFQFVKEVELKSGEDISDLLYEDWKEDNLKVELETNTSVLNIKYQSKNKETVIPVLEKLSKRYQEYSKRDRIRGIKKGLSYLDDQINDYSIKSRDSLEILDNFASKYNLIPVIDSTETSIGSDLTSPFNSLGLESAPLFTTSIEEQKLSASKLIEESEYKIEEIDKLFNSKNPKNISEKLYYITSTIPELNKQGLPDRLVTLETRLINLREKFKESDISIQKTIYNRDFTIKILRDRAKAFLNAKISEANAIIEKSKRPEGIITKFKELYRRSVRDSSTLARLEVQKSALALEQARTEEPWELISIPSLLKDPVYPRKLRFIASGLLAGLIIGCFGAYYKEKISGIIYDSNTLLKLVPYPLLRIFTLKNRNSWQDFVDLLIENKMFTEKDPLCAIIPTSKKYIKGDLE